jgi:UDP-2-acetamido-3-amino-2,3-dideoxy-glucuronate N-acetyltransferase
VERVNVDSDRQCLRDVLVGDGVRIWSFVNAYECEIGDESLIGTFVELQRGVKIGKRCHISSHTFLCEGVTLEDEVFVGHGVIFVNDNHPSGRPAHWDNWRMQPVLVRAGAAIGSGALILGGVTIGREATVGAGAVVTADVADGMTVVGVPARPIGASGEVPGRKDDVRPKPT